MRTELVAATLAVALLTSADASAFCRTRTVPVPPDVDSSTGCFDQGVVLYHPSQCLPYRLIASEAPAVPNAVLSEGLARAFATWTTPNDHCVPGIAPVELATVARERVVSYETGSRGDNIVGFVSPWPHREAGSTLALATLTFRADTGEVYDVDLELNGEDIFWSMTGGTPPEGHIDLHSVLTHEAGHVLGLAHSDQANATMFANYLPGSTDMRSLEDDDERAICDAYPTRLARSTAAGLVPATACELAPGSPEGACGDPEISHGCAIEAARRPGAAPGAIALAAAAAVLALSRGASSRRRRAPRR